MRKLRHLNVGKEVWPLSESTYTPLIVPQRNSSAMILACEKDLTLRAKIRLLFFALCKKVGSVLQK